MNTSVVQLMQIDLSVGAPIEVNQARRCIPITGGKVTGVFSGAVLSGGADWQQIGADGTIDIDARYVLELAEGRVEVESRGLRAGSPDILARLAKGEAINPAFYYFRTAIRFQTEVPALQRLNRILAISHGERLADAVRLTIYEVP
ncbi:MAG: DUF3237 family protein [Sphingomonadaceae bacterium]|nr:DUF3237 family protein [Sphingomonadaceae bacterium]